MKEMVLKNTGLILVIMGLFSCSDSSKSNNEEMAMADTDSMAINHSGKGEPVKLFDGVSLQGWHGFNKAGQEIKNWMIEDSALVCLGAAKDAAGGDIVSDEEFEDFELTWDWKVTKGGNSGVMYHVIESPKYKSPYETGPEYQMIDDIGFPKN